MVHLLVWWTCRGKKPCRE